MKVFSICCVFACIVTTVRAASELDNYYNKLSRMSDVAMHRGKMQAAKNRKLKTMLVARKSVLVRKIKANLTYITDEPQKDKIAARIALLIESPREFFKTSGLAVAAEVVTKIEDYKQTNISKWEENVVGAFELGLLDDPEKIKAQLAQINTGIIKLLNSGLLGL